MDTLQSLGYTPFEITQLGQSRNRLGMLRQVLKGKATIVWIGEPPKADIDPIVRIERDKRIAYPTHIETVLHPELEYAGPAAYDLSKVELWTDGRLVDGVATGFDHYKSLKDADMIGSCLDLRDGNEIVLKGLAAFRAHFAGKTLVLWKSVGRSSAGTVVPTIYEEHDELVVYWAPLSAKWNARVPAARFPQA